MAALTVVDGTVGPCELDPWQPRLMATSTEQAMEQVVMTIRTLTALLHQVYRSELRQMNPQRPEAID